MWHEARRSEKRVHEMMDAAKKRAERRADQRSRRAGDPTQLLRVAGTKLRLAHDSAVYQSAQDLSGLIPWNNREDTLIDRFDGRAMLDFIREYDPHRHRAMELTEQQEEEEEACNFERYRDLVRLGWHAKTEEEGLQQVEREMEARAHAQLKANRSPIELSSSLSPFHLPFIQAKTACFCYSSEPFFLPSSVFPRPKLPAAAAASAATPAAGKGAYANMPFSYGSSDYNAGDYMAERYGIEEYGRHMDLAVSALEKERRLRQMAGNDSRPSRKERKKLARQGKEGGTQGKKQQGKGEGWKQQGLVRPSLACAVHATSSGRGGQGSRGRGEGDSSGEAEAADGQAAEQTHQKGYSSRESEEGGAGEIEAS
ncbi:unnamed protein product [Closterium sp. Yama58-4]|nr:unnamed protein product [Closterium sp. Yama58-4]